MGTERSGELASATAGLGRPGSGSAGGRDARTDPWRWALVVVLGLMGLIDYVALNVVVWPRCVETRAPMAAAPSTPQAPATPPQAPATASHPRATPPVVAASITPAAAEPGAATPPAAAEPGTATPPAAAEPGAGALPEIEDIHFVTNSSALLEGGLETMERVARLMAGRHGQRVRLRGHADERGEGAANQRLSERRAAAVAAFLRRRGISLDRIEIEGVGERMPADRSGTPEARARNRRVEVFWE